MEFNYLHKKDSRNLIKDIFVLKFIKEDLPFKTKIISLGFPSIVYTFSDQQNAVFKGKKTPLKGLNLMGQFYGSFDFFVNDESSNIGFTLNPSCLYKILNKKASLFTNKHIPLKEVNLELAEKLETLFLKYKNDIPKLEEKIVKFIDSLKLTIDNDILMIDKAIDYIFEKKGLLQVNDLVSLFPFSQKSLELKFKKIIGLTPINFIKMIRFNKLMIKYQSKEIDLKDLIFKYNYYDYSHFTRDFKFFMNQSPKLFFKEDYPLMDKYLKD